MLHVQRVVTAAVAQAAGVDVSAVVVGNITGTNNGMSCTFSIEVSYSLACCALFRRCPKMCLTLVDAVLVRDAQRRGWTSGVLAGGDVHAEPH